MADHDYISVAQLRGSATRATAGDPSGFVRANYVAALHSWTTPAHLLAGHHHPRPRQR